MKKRIISYRTKVDELLNKEERVDWKSVLDEHLTQIAFFQHERIVHLLVTLCFALMSVITLCAAIATEYMYLMILEALFIVLLVPYVFHYYTLENEVQKMYVQYDQIIAKMR